MPPPQWGDYLEPPFTCEVEIAAERAWVRLAGELDLATVPALDARLERLADGGEREIFVDLGELSFIDSSGLHLLVKWSRRAIEEGVAFSLGPGPPAVQRVFSLAGVEHLLPFAQLDPGAEDAGFDGV